MNVKDILKKYAHFLPLAIPLLTLTVYSPVAWHDFVNYDDSVYVTENTNVQAGITLAALRWAFTPGYDANWMPLTWISHMLDVQLFGLNPAGHHLMNVLLHAASATVLFLCLRRMTGLPWRCAAVSALFALHPLHVESVAWVAERKDVLSGLLWMLTIWAYVRYAERPETGRYLAAIFLFALGLMAKPMLVTLPVVLLLLDYWPLRRFVVPGPAAAAPGKVTAASNILLEKVPFLFLAGCSAAATFLFHTSGGGTHDQYTLSAKFFRAFTYYVEYIGKMLWPSKLAVIYPFAKYPPTVVEITAAVLFLLAVTVSVVFLRKRHPWLVTGWFWYLITLLPVIGLVHIGQHSVADRYTYLPLTGLFIILVWGITEAAESRHRTPLPLGIASSALLVTIIVVTSIQITHWKNPVTLFSHAVAVTNGNWVAHNNLGQAYFDLGKLDEAIQQFKLSIAAKPSYAIAFSNLGVTYYQKGEKDLSLEHFKQAVQFDPANAKAHYCIGLLHLEAGDAALALKSFNILKGQGSPYAIELMREIINGYEGNSPPSAVSRIR